MLRQLEKLQDVANSQVNVYYFIIGLGPALKEIDVDINSKYGKLMDKCKRAGVQFIAMNLHNRKGKYRINEFVNINYIVW
jgi:DNA-binding sugar fermentation-stimulating protein